MPFLNFLPLRYWREGAIGVLVLAISYISLQWKQTDAELKKAKLAYENPATKETVRVVEVKGPVRVEYRTIEKPGGERIIWKNVYRDEVKKETNTVKDSAPVPVKDITAPVRTDRWLLGVSNRSFTFQQIDHYGAWGGYSWRNRADVLLGFEKNAGAEAHLLFVWRF